MKCFHSSSGQRQRPAVATTIGVGLLAWLRGMFPSVASPGSVSPELPGGGGAASADQSSCAVATVLDWKRSCDVELDIFTDVTPQDLVAIAAVFRWADDLSSQLRCSRKQYPVKAIVAGGGFSPKPSARIVRAYLADLRRAGLVPADDRFNIQRQVLEGPTLQAAYAPQLVDASQVWNWTDHRPLPQETVDLMRQDPLRSISLSLPTTLTLLTRQKAPIIVALRPMLEFVPVWAEPGIKRVPRTVVPGIPYSQQRLQWDPLLFDGAMEAFQRARVVTYGGNSSLARVGHFLTSHVLSEPRGPAALRLVSELEEAYVTTPAQMLLVDRRSFVGEDGLERPPLFTALSQERVFAQFRRVAAASSRLLHYTSRSNMLITDTIDAAMAKTWSGEAWSSLGGGLPKHLQQSFNDLRNRASRISKDLVLGRASQAVMQEWQQDVQRLGRQMRGRVLRYFRNYQGHPVSNWIGKFLPPLDSWSRWALIADSFVKTSSLLVPFCLYDGDNDNSDENNDKTNGIENVVRTSLQQVRYGGRDADGSYIWTPAAFSNSTVWYTGGGGGSGMMEPLQADLQRLYIRAFTPRA